MRLILSFILFVFSFQTFANSSLVLLPADGEGEGIILESHNKDVPSTENTNEDLELFGDDYSESPSFADRHLTVEGQVSMTIMALEARGSVGVRGLNDYIELGIDGGLLLIAAGTDGALVPEVGVYAKIRFNPEAARTVYFKGRLYKAWGLNDEIERLAEYGVGMEMDNGGFIELSLKHFKFDDGDQFFLPFVSMGTRFGGPKPARNGSGEPLLFGN